VPEALWFCTYAITSVSASLDGGNWANIELKEFSNSVKDTMDGDDLAARSTAERYNVIGVQITPARCAVI